MVQISEAIVCFVYCASVYKDKFFQMFFYFLPIIYMFIFNIEYNSSWVILE